MGYEIDLEKITLEEYKKLLKKQKLLAGRRLLKEDIDERFNMLYKAGITNVNILYSRLEDEQQLQEVSKATGIPAEYLIILKREISNILQKPVLIADFPYISPPAFKKLGENCIQTSRDFYELSQGCTKPESAQAKTGISLNDAQELCVLCDLIRINGVGPVFSRVLLEAGFRKTDEIAAASADLIYEKTSEINKLHAYTRAIPEISEIQLCIDFAGLLVKT